MLDGVRPLSKETIADAHEETQLLSRLITDLRDLSLAEAGQLPLDRRPTDLGELARASVGRLTSRARDKEIDLRTEVSEDTEGLPKVEADPDRISQVLANLLENALRHTPESGRVMVSLEPEDGEEAVRMMVHDTGAGVPEDDLPNVFERFYRADRARSRSEGGSGVGLAVVKQLVEAHGGRVSVKSTPGQGASFGFTLPAVGTGSRVPKRAQESEEWTHNGCA